MVVLLLVLLPWQLMSVNLGGQSFCQSTDGLKGGVYLFRVISAIFLQNP